MPLCDLLLQYQVDQLVLLDHRQALELGRLNLDRVHRSAAAADVLYLEFGSACHSHNMLCTVTDATVAGVVSAMRRLRHAARAFVDWRPESDNGHSRRRKDCNR